MDTRKRGVNPFNGIERGINTSGDQIQDGHAKNPFNGIESFPVIISTFVDIFNVNPFNGIESHRRGL